MSDEPRAQRRVQSRLSPVWIVPLVAILIGLWLVYDNYAQRGPLITLEMPSAEGIEAGKTLIKTRNVEVGRVESVRLSDDLSHTVITARMSHDAERMLNEGSNFWVVKPRIGREGISGLMVDPDGIVWGVAEEALFAYDPATGESTVEAIVGGRYSAGTTYWAYGTVNRSSADGRIYVTAGYRFSVHDPATGETTRIANGLQWSAVDGAGDVYLSAGANLFRYDVEEVEWARCTEKPAADIADGLIVGMFGGDHPLENLPAHGLVPAMRRQKILQGAWGYAGPIGDGFDALARQIGELPRDIPPQVFAALTTRKTPAITIQVRIQFPVPSTQIASIHDVVASGKSVIRHL